MAIRRILKETFLKKFGQNIFNCLAVNAIFHYKSVETLSCHSNQTNKPIFITRGPRATRRFFNIFLVTFCILVTMATNNKRPQGPRFAHLSDIATADMQMLCNIFPILSSQLMKISSFEQFLVLKKNIWA